MTTLKACCLSIMLMVSSVAGGAAGQDVPARVYTVGVEDLNYYPLHTTSNGAEFGGYARDVLDSFARQQGITFRYVPLPINRLYVAFLKEQALDFKYPDNPRWKPELRGALTINYSTPLVASEEGALVLPKNRGRSPGRLRTLGTALGFTPWPYLPDIERKRIALVVNSGFDGLLRHALAGHIDAVYLNVDVADHLLTEKLKAPGALVLDPGLPHTQSNFSLATLRHTNVIGELDAFLRREQALLQKLKAKYKVEERVPP